MKPTKGKTRTLKVEKGKFASFEHVVSCIRRLNYKGSIL